MRTSLPEVKSNRLQRLPFLKNPLTPVNHLAFMELPEFQDSLFVSSSSTTRNYTAVMESEGMTGRTTFELLKLMTLQYAQQGKPAPFPGGSLIKEEQEQHPLAYRIWATIIHATIFILGVAGNVVLVIVVRKTRSLQTSTYCYLVSLAVADLMVLLSAVPEAIISHHIGWKWITGQLGCSAMVFFNFLGINVGSLSILAFTLDRYIAACRPLLILKICNWSYARKVVICLWIFSILYCAPWLGLTEVRPDPDIPDIEICDFRVPREVTVYWFITDIILFYVCPLIVAAVIYTRLGLILRRSIASFRVAARNAELGQKESRTMDTWTGGGGDTLERMNNGGGGTATPIGERQVCLELELLKDRPLSSAAVAATGGGGSSAANLTERIELPPEDAWAEPPVNLKHRYGKLRRSRTRVFRMLVIIVVLFAVTWLPYRSLLVYNSLSATPWYNLLFLFFAKTCIYANCAVNPYLYNIMSRRFREGLWTTLTCSSGGSIKN
ncbi:putative Thyrotropin-releasing hormone receptor [Hypsibius exemplaris]|uniref:Thyrotropin-releasing hormone receptor n=1 Tax=Hypsibius exemplaris TaxID=2072580 RepID=A0A1W0X1X9_HYPEX|nr:putative Thyrotropin-releasing hormone receptor [Hypsibius exemplaris]